MKSVNPVTSFKCVDEFTRAIEVLGKTVFEIEKMYGINLPLLFNNEKLIVEIESRRATICCLLDQNLICTTSCLFCSDDNDLLACVEYCNANYAAFGRDCWRIPVCRIEHIPGKEPCLVFVQKK